MIDHRASQAVAVPPGAGTAETISRGTIPYEAAGHHR